MSSSVLKLNAVAFLMFLWNVPANTNQLRLLPDHPNVAVGNILQLNCTLSSTQQYTSSDIEFECALVEPKRSEFVLGSRKKIINRRKLQLNHPNIGLEYDRATVTCYVRQNHQIAASQIIRVGYEPSVPVITSYIVDQRASGRFIFTWKTNISDHRVPTKYTAWFKPSGRSDFRSCRVCNSKSDRCPMQKDSSCMVPHALGMVHPNGILYFKVNASNAIGRTESDVIVKDLYYLVKPAPVRDATVLYDGSTPVVKFLGPRAPNSYTNEFFYYNMSVTCETSPIFKKQYDLVRSRSVYNNQALKGLPDYTWCTVSVVRKTDYINLEYGFWSDPVVAFFRSQEGVPLSAPEMCTSCFSVLPSRQHNQREVMLYFKHLDENEARGKVHKYRPCSVDPVEPMGPDHGQQSSRDIMLYDCNEASNQNLSSSDSINTSVRLELSSSHGYYLSVIAATSAGFSKRVNISRGVRIPAASSVLPGPQNITVITQKDGSVSITWNKEDVATSYTVLWCLVSDTSDKVTCNISANDSLNWQILTKEQSAYTVNGLTKVDNYLFGVAVEVDSESSGIVWSDCVYDVRANREPPFVKFEPDQAVVEVTITKKLCTQSKAYLYAFVIHCCPPNSRSGCRSKYVDHYGKHRFDGLTPDTVYTFVVEPLSVGNPLYHNSTPALIRTLPGPVSSGFVVGTTIGSIVAAVLVVAGLITLIRKFKKLFNCCENYWKNLPIRVPSIDINLDKPKSLGDRSDDADGRPSSVYVNEPSKSQFCKQHEKSETGNTVSEQTLLLLSSSNNVMDETASDQSEGVESSAPETSDTIPPVSEGAGNDSSHCPHERSAYDGSYSSRRSRSEETLASDQSEYSKIYTKCVMNSRDPVNPHDPVYNVPPSRYVGDVRSAGGLDCENITASQTIVSTTSSTSQQSVYSHDFYQQAAFFDRSETLGAAAEIGEVVGAASVAATAAGEDPPYTPGVVVDDDYVAGSSIYGYSVASQLYISSANSDIDSYTVAVQLQ